MCLRVQPELSMARNISKSKYAFQPSAVFVDFASLPPEVLKSWTCNLDFFPPADGTIVKTVQITKLLSPKERAKVSSTAVNRVPNSQENTDSITQETGVTDEAESLSRASQGIKRRIFSQIVCECLYIQCWVTNHLPLP